MSLVPVHGGGPLTNRVLPLTARKALLADAEGMSKISVTDADLSVVYRIADGTLSPLQGFMDEATFNRVLDRKNVAGHDGKDHAWTIPLSLPVTDAEAARLKPGTRAALVNAGGDVFGTITVSGVFAWDKQRYVERVYGTSRSTTPAPASPRTTHGLR